MADSDEYEPTEDGWHQSGVTSNESELAAEANATLSEALAELQSEALTYAVYNGMQVIPVDGSIHQTTWTFDQDDGFFTSASRNSEHDTRWLSYAARRRIEDTRPQQLAINREERRLAKRIRREVG